MLPAAPCRPPRRCPFVNGVLSCPRRQTDRRGNAIANANAKRTPATPGVLLLCCAGFRLSIRPFTRSACSTQGTPSPHRNSAVVSCLQRSTAKEA